MIVNELGKLISGKVEHSLKAPYSIDVTDAGMVILVRFEQPENVDGAIEVMLLGRFIDVMDLHQLKAPDPIRLTEFGISMLVSEVQK